MREPSGKTIAKARQIKLLALDCDGVLTDGRLHYLGALQPSANSEIQVGMSFHAQDGHAMKMLMRGGVEIAVISGRGSAAFDHRMRELGIDHAYSNVADKRATLSALLDRLGVDRSTLAVMGDDIPDLALFESAALSFAPADAHPVIRERADYVTEAAGGRGAVCEVAMLILRFQNKLDAMLTESDPQ